MLSKLLSSRVNLPRKVRRIEAVIDSKGIPVVVLDEPPSDLATVGLFFSGGSSVDLPLHSGISHLLEHLAFQRNYNNKNRELLVDIEKAGGFLTAYTTREETTFMGVSHVEAVAKTCLGLSVLASNIESENEALQKEKSVVKSEMLLHEEDTKRMLFDRIMTEKFGFSGLGLPIIGKQEFLEEIKLHHLSEHWNLTYTLDNVYIVSSNFEGVEGILSVLCESLWNCLGTNYNALEQNAMSLPLQNTHLADDRNDVKHVILWLDAPSYKHHSYTALMLYSYFLSEGTYSKLHQEIREKRGLTYGVECFYEAFRAGGIFGIYLGVEKCKVSEVLACIKSLLLTIPQELTIEDLNQVKLASWTGTHIQLESARNRVAMAGSSLVKYGEVYNKVKVLHKISQVDLAGFRKVAESIKDLIEDGKMKVNIS